jgi:hypothetical protein
MFDGDCGLAILLRNLEGPVLQVAFDILVVNLAADKSLGVEDGVFGVGVVRVLGAVTDTGAKNEHKPRLTRRVTHSRSSSVKLTHEGVIR